MIGPVRHTDPDELDPAASGQASARADGAALAARIKVWGRELGFDAVGISGVDLSAAERGLVRWLESDFHGELDYMERYGTRRSRPAELVPGTLSVISVRLGYWPRAAPAETVLSDPDRAYVSRYALGRDYHKVLRGRLARLAGRIAEEAGPHGHRVFTDSAPVMEVEIARQAGLGWRGKHTLLIDRHAGSWFFLGEIYTDLPLPADPPAGEHCGTCTRCIAACPTGAIVAPYRLDARRCISYLTIELKGAIPTALRPLIGNRVYGCDDCQLVCPWNRDAGASPEDDFRVRHGLDNGLLTALMGWSRKAFERRMEGSAIRRIGWERWLRNLAVGLGNVPRGSSGAGAAVVALRAQADHDSELVREHVRWALDRHGVPEV